MRRLFVLLVVLAMFLAMPLASATAQDERFEVDIHTYVTLVGQDARGCDILTGGFVVVAGGVTVETGDARMTACVAEDVSRAHYKVRYRDASTGNIVSTDGKAGLVDADFDAGVLSYSFRERIRSSTDGIDGHVV